MPLLLAVILEERPVGRARVERTSEPKFGVQTQITSERVAHTRETIPKAGKADASERGSRH